MAALQPNVGGRVSQPIDRRCPHWSHLRNVWRAMRNRCTRANNPSFVNYGGRGISVCTEWLESFQSFYRWAIDSGFEPTLEIDRIDNDGNYEPSNCRWVTHIKNNHNHRRNVTLTAFGETKVLREWARDSRCAVSSTRLGERIRHGWNAEAAITTLPYECQKGGLHHSAITKDVADKISALSAEGLSAARISKLMNISQGRVYAVRHGRAHIKAEQIAKSFGLPDPVAHELADEKGGAE